MTAPAIIHDLVQRFRDSRELYRSGRYNEAQLRQEFLNPLFETLGWDMFNRSNFAPQYREVIHEDSLEDEGSLKAPDYAFRIGTTRKFFVEAKKPAVDIRYAIHPAYQLRRYAWNAHLPLSILTDFEELAVYDCRTRPDPKDSAATGRVMLFTFEEYLTRWDELAQIFSREAVWNGSFDRYAEGSKGKRGTTEVDAEFLKEIEQWRLLLARNIALRNFRSSARDPIVPPVPGSFPGLSTPSTTPDRQGSIAADAHLTPASRNQPSAGLRLSKERADSITPSEEGDEGGGSLSLTQEGLSKQSHNLHRAERQLNYAVQTTIDRILFLRICEDRQIEPTDQLLQIAEGSDIYAQLLKLFQKADQKYNSGLFHFNKEKTQTSEPDTFTPTLQIDDKVLRQVIKSTYYPCPYMFNEIPVEILGQVYEQFLGSVIRLTPGGQAKVEEKPEVRKAGGVYYTPRYIVDYIVENTLGRLLGVSKPVGETCHGLPANEVQPSFQVPHPPSAGLRPSSPIPLRGSSTLRPKEGLEGVGSNRSLSGETSTNINSQQSGLTSLTPSSVAVGGGSGGGSFNQLQQDPLITPAEALKLRVVDPACGSGSFLLGAYQYLLDWHLNYYLTHDPESHTRGKNPPLVATEGGEYCLTTQTKKQILTSSIYGVDIDSQAVEVTKLSLLLKLLEGETGQLTLGFERVLPDLGQNIRCGNSLIGWDYFQGQMFPDEEEIHRVNPFDWQRAFPQVFAAGGFDTVIGNPPYIRQESLGEDKPYYQSIYEVFTGTADIYSYFIEKGVKLLAPGGQFSYIVANKWLRAKYGFKLRQWLKTKSIEEITDFGDLPIFTGATTYPLILRVSNNPPHFHPRLTNVKTLDFASLQEYVDEYGEISDQTCFEEDGWSLAGKQTQDLLAKIRQNSIPLGEYVGGKVYRGILTGLNKAFVIDQETKDRLIAKDPRSAELIKPFAQGRDIKRYASIPVKQYLILIPKGWTNQHRKGNAWNWFSSQYPAIASHLKQFEKEAIARGDKGEFWWELRACDYYDEFEKPKIVYPDISLRGNFAIDLNGIHYGNTAYIMPVDDVFLLALLNSDLFDFYYRQISSSYRGGYLRYIYQYVTQLPVMQIDESKQDQLAMFKKITDLVNNLLVVNRQKASYPREGQQLKNIKIEIEKQINLQVFDLYGLDDEEIRMVSGQYSKGMETPLTKRNKE